MVAASLGGRDVLARLLAPLPATFPAPVLVVQHVGARETSHLPALLAPHTALRVRHAEAGERVRAGTVYVAPPARHLVVGADGRCALTDARPETFVRPAADVLFRSAARAFGARTLAVVLTGRLTDGAAGAVAVRAAGGVVLAQDPATCRAPGMPSAAIRAGAAHLVLLPDALGAALLGLMVGGAPVVPTGAGARAA